MDGSDPVNGGFTKSTENESCRKWKILVNYLDTRTSSIAEDKKKYLPTGLVGDASSGNGFGRLIYLTFLVM